MLWIVIWIVWFCVSLKAWFSPFFYHKWNSKHNIIDIILLLNQIPRHDKPQLYKIRPNFHQYMDIRTNNHKSILLGFEAHKRKYRYYLDNIYFHQTFDSRHESNNYNKYKTGLLPWSYSLVDTDIYQRYKLDGNLQFHDIWNSKNSPNQMLSYKIWYLNRQNDIFCIYNNYIYIL
jgi:hypothetical protein